MRKQGQEPGCESGFTLLEVMIALVILAVTSAAMLKAIFENVRNTAQLEEKSIAMLIADNELNKIYAGKEWPVIGESKDNISMSDRNWLVSVAISNTDNPDVRQVKVSVRRNDSERTYAELIGFVGRF